jgi:hypothetical protein
MEAHVMKTNRTQGLSPAAARKETLEFRLLIAFTMLLFLPIAAASRLLPRAWRPLAAFSDESEGIYVEARRAAAIVVPCVFMG